LPADDRPDSTKYPYVKVQGDELTFEVTDDEVRVARDREPGVFVKWAGRFRTGRGQTAAEIDRALLELRGRG
jgi:hypothetical protein